MAGIGVPELIVILFLVLVLFGPGKMPKIGKAIGETIHEVKKGITGSPGEEINEHHDFTKEKHK